MRESEQSVVGGSPRLFLLSRGAVPLVLMFIASLTCGATECAPEQLIGGWDDYNTGKPSIDVGPMGAAWVVWDGEVSVDDNVYWCVDTGSGWSEPAAFGGGVRPVVSVDCDGTPWVVWRVSGGLISKHWSGSSWTEMEVVAGGVSRDGRHDVLAQRADDIWVATEDVTSANENQIWAYHWDGDQWGGPWELGLPGRRDRDPDLAVSPDGLIGLVWNSHEWAFGPCDIVYSEWDGSSWTTPAAVDTGTEYRRFPKLVYDGGTPMVLWSHEAGAAMDIVYSRYEGGVWSPRGMVSLPDGTMDTDTWPRCESNDAGDIVAVWHNYNGPELWETPVVASWWEGGCWVPEEKLSNDAPYKMDMYPDAALDSNGVLWTAWRCYDEMTSIDELIHGTTCVRDFTPVDFAVLEAVSDGPEVTLTWYAGGEAAEGPFWVWRSPTPGDGLSCLGSPGSTAEILNGTPITSDPYTFIDSTAEGGLYCYWVEWESAHSPVFLGPVVSGPAEAQDGCAIRLVYVWPNPTGDGVTAGVDCPTSAEVELRVYSIAGREVARTDRSGGAGANEGDLRLLHWDGTDNLGNEVAAGVYVMRVVVDGKAVPGECAATTVLR